jgi:hypothetical protein
MRTAASVIVVASVVAMLVIEACERKPLQDVPVTDGVTFEENIKPITSKVCIRCHTGNGRDWSQYRDAFSHRYQIYNRIVLIKDMPQGVFMSEKDRALFRDWYNQGAKP